MKYDFAHPRFRNGIVTFDEKKPDLLYEFRKEAAFHRYDVRNGILYSPDKKQIATVYNRFESVFIHMLKDKKTYRLSSKKDIDLFFNDIKENFNGDNNMKLTEAKEILKNAGYIVEDTDDWDDADLPAGMTQKQRRNWARKHNATTEDDFRKFGGNKRWNKQQEFEDYYGTEPIDDDDAELNGEGRKLANKVSRGKNFNMTPENNSLVAEIFELLKKSGWKYINAKMGYEKNSWVIPEEKYFYFKKPGKGKKDYVMGFSVDPDETKKKSKTIHVEYTTNSDGCVGGGGDFYDAADFVDDMNYSYKCEMESKKSYNKKSNEPDYEEMAALAYEDR